MFSNKKSLLLAAFMAIFGALCVGASEQEGERSYKTRKFVGGEIPFEPIESAIEEEIHSLEDVTITSFRSRSPRYFFSKSQGVYIFGFTATVNGVVEEFRSCKAAFFLSNDIRGEEAMVINIRKCKHDEYYFDSYIIIYFRDMGIEPKSNVRRGSVRLR